MEPQFGELWESLDHNQRAALMPYSETPGYCAAIDSLEALGLFDDNGITALGDAIRRYAVLIGDARPVSPGRYAPRDVRRT